MKNSKSYDASTIGKPVFLMLRQSMLEHYYVFPNHPSFADSTKLVRAKRIRSPPPGWAFNVCNVLLTPA